MQTRKGSVKVKDRKRVRILFDSGCGSTLINKEFVKKLKTIKTAESTWKTKAGNFKTNAKVKAKFIMPEFYANGDIEWTVHVDNSSRKESNYDMIIGRDLLHELGIDLLFSQGKMQWEGSSIPMRNPETMLPENIET